jgi:hypothetical protein
MSDSPQYFADAMAALSPVSGEEMPVVQLVVETHRRCCVPAQHDPACNTLRLLAEDQAALLRDITPLRRNAQLVVRVFADCYEVGGTVTTERLARAVKELEKVLS